MLPTSQGLGDGAYLAAMWLWHMGLYCAFLAVLLAGGWALGLKAFTLNDVGVQVGSARRVLSEYPAGWACRGLGHHADPC